MALTSNRVIPRDFKVNLIRYPVILPFANDTVQNMRIVLEKVKTTPQGEAGIVPRVAAMVVRADGSLVGEAVKNKRGMPHAERLAIADALRNNFPRNQNLLELAGLIEKPEEGTEQIIKRVLRGRRTRSVRDFFRDCALYLNLESCNSLPGFGRFLPHWGCGDFIAAFNIGRVVIAHADNDPFMGRGVNELVSKGVQVECGVLAKEAARLNFLFLLRNIFYRKLIEKLYSEIESYNHIIGYIVSGIGYKFNKGQMIFDFSSIHQFSYQDNAGYKDSFIQRRGPEYLDENSLLFVTFLTPRLIEQIEERYILLPKIIIQVTDSPKHDFSNFYKWLKDIGISHSVMLSQVPLAAFKQSLPWQR